MKALRLRKILEDVLKGKISLDEAERKIRLHAVDKIEDILRIDLGREQRRDVPEIIFAEYKSNDMLRKIIERTVESSGRVILSRVREDQVEVIKEFSGKYEVKICKYGKVAVVRRKDIKVEKTGGRVGIIAAGTADIELVEEIKMIAEELGCETTVLCDVGIASLKRTLDAVKEVVEKDVDVIVAVAGMEAALPSIVASLVNVPVIGLPSSKGYGMGGKGEAALLSILQACVPGVLTVNVDNSVGAAIGAVLIANRAAKFRRACGD